MCRVRRTYRHNMPVLFQTRSNYKNLSFIEHFAKLHIKPQGLNSDPAQTRTQTTNHEADKKKEKTDLCKFGAELPTSW